jgi:hypothetical protein
MTRARVRAHATRHTHLQRLLHVLIELIGPHHHLDLHGSRVRTRPGPQYSASRLVPSPLQHAARCNGRRRPPLVHSIEYAQS